MNDERTTFRCANRAHDGADPHKSAYTRESRKGNSKRNGPGMPPACTAAGMGDWAVACEADGCTVNAPWAMSRIIMR